MRFVAGHIWGLRLVRSGRLLLSAAGALAVDTVTSTRAWAVQSHGGAEGLVSHQIGHFLLVVGLTYLVYRLYAMRLQGKGWSEFRVFLWLLILWNVMTFSGHWMDELVDRAKFIKENGANLFFAADGFPDVLYYLTRLDHLVLVPSFAFLLVALRKWRAPQ